MVVCGNIFTKVKQRVIIKMLNDQHEIDFAEFEDPDNKINSFKTEDFVVIKLDDKCSSKINEAYFIEKCNSNKRGLRL